MASQPSKLGLHFHSAPEIAISNTRTSVTLLGPCYKTGGRNPYTRQQESRPRPRHSLGLQGSCKQDHTYLPKAHIRRNRNTPVQGKAKRLRSPGGRSDVSPHPLPQGRRPTLPEPTDSFPYFRQFQILLTLFSKSFSLFPRGTCALSVFYVYLALEGIYLPLRLHSQAIRLSESGPYEANSKP